MKVIVDLTECSFFDSAGLAALLATRERLERANRSLALVLANPTVLKVFQITGFDERFEIYPSLGVAADRAEVAMATSSGGHSAMNRARRAAGAIAAGARACRPP